MARFLLLLLVSALAPSLAEAADPINAIIGDASGSGDAGTEVERIRAHLRFVEARLRVDPAIDAERLARRHAALDALARYREAGVFPRRTRDPYPGRRPRFIDDRGVHCAVGEMIRATGHAELARRIDERFEYAYVEQIREPGLVRWAKRFGFSVKELAMVQPSYSPVPNDELIEGEVQGATERLTLQCAKEHEPATSFRLRVLYRPRGRVSFRSMRWFDGFVRCFLEKARESVHIGGGAYDQEPHRVRTWMRVQVESPQAILERRLGAIDLGSDSTPCFPRPGAVPTEVAMRVRVDDQGLHVDATTAPSNEAIDECLEAHVAERLGEPFGPGRWRLDATVEQAVEPRVNDAQVRRMLESYLPGFATECWPEGEPSRVEVTVTAERGADDLTFAIEGEEGFRACLEPKLRERLRQMLGTHVAQPDGTRVPYFRVDTEVSATVAVDVETPTDREARIQRQREEMERRMAEERQYY